MRQTISHAKHPHQQQGFCIPSPKIRNMGSWVNIQTPGSKSGIPMPFDLPEYWLIPEDDGPSNSLQATLLPSSLKYLLFLPPKLGLPIFPPPWPAVASDI